MIDKTKIVAFDLDGTLLNDNRQVSANNTETLKLLGEKGIIRVVATGRNYYSLRNVLPADFPVDYALFSSGAGILDWEKNEILTSWHLNRKQIAKAVELILPADLNFTINLPIPNNHHMLVHLSKTNPDDLAHYTSFYQEYVQEMDLSQLPDKATQMIVLLNNNIHLYNEFKQKLPFAKLVLTTSPINNKSMWMEVFHPHVSKAKGITWLCKQLEINESHSFSIGNDYNDIDMLEHTHYSFVVNNAPQPLKQKFTCVCSNNEDGFSEAIWQVLKLHE